MTCKRVVVSCGVVVLLYCVGYCVVVVGCECLDCMHLCCDVINIV